MPPHTQPSTLLKTAESLISINQPHTALQTLSETFTSKRFRSTPITSLEPIVLRFIELCVTLRRGRTAKEGLMQYKNVAQQVDVKSIEGVINHFLSLSNEKVNEAIKKAEEVTAKDDQREGAEVGEVEDLEASETPESILLGAVSGDGDRERTDRALVTPWLKFLWEAYRTSLEVLKNSARLEAVYQQTAHAAFAFCLSHKRKVEFKRLCEILRAHLTVVTKYGGAAGQPQHANAINLADPAVLQSHLDTRLVQLKVSVELELWQEAFRSLEDVHHLLLLASPLPGTTTKDTTLGLGAILNAAANSSSGIHTSGGVPPHKDTKSRQRLIMLANYYEKCTRIFLMSGSNSGTSSPPASSLFHAAAWSRYWAVIGVLNGGLNAPSTSEEGKDKPYKTKEEIELIAGQVVVSALAVPVTSPSAEEGSGKSKHAKLTALLGLNSMPTRKGLLGDAITQQALTLSSPVIKDLYELLEVRFDPLGLSNSVSSVFKGFSDSSAETPSPYLPYKPLLERALLSRLLAHLSQVYTTIKLDRLYELVEPLTGEDNSSTFFTPPSLESYVMGCARRGELAVRVDHLEGCLVFIDEPFTSAVSSAPASAGAQETPIQPSLSSMVQSRLTDIALSLQKSLYVITPPPPALSKEEQAEKYKTLLAAVNAERQGLITKRRMVARRRELLSELNVRKEAEESSARIERSRREREEKERREREDNRKKEMAMKLREIERIREDEFKKQADNLVSKGIISKVDLEGMDKQSTDNLITLQVSQFEKEKKELNTRLRTLQKKMDHTERAYRKVEQPFLTSDYSRQQEQDKESHAIAQVQMKDEAKRDWEEGLRNKNRLGRMVGDYGSRLEVMRDRKRREFDDRKKEAQRRMEREIEKRRTAAREAREAEEREREEEERIERERIEEERRLEEERIAEEERIEAEAEAARQAEEKKKRDAEEAAAAARAAREKERQEAAEQARLQIQREEEAEARRAARRLAEKEAAATPPTRRPTAGLASGLASSRSNGSVGGENVWRRSALKSETNTPGHSVPTTPTKAAYTPPERTESPAPGKYRPGQGLGGGGGGWRAREESRKTGPGGASTPVRPGTPAGGGRSESPAPPPKKEDAAADDDGFTTVPARGSGGVWKRGRGRF